MKFETLKPTYYPAWGFRPGVQCIPLKMNFIFINGGMGDYICWMQPIRWLASQATWIKGTLIHPTYMGELAQYWLKEFPEWDHANYEELQKLPQSDDTPFRGPVELNRESLNATGAHLSTCGWVYFTNKEKAPAGWDNYPVFKQSDLDDVLSRLDLGLPEKYAVLPVGVTTNSRRIKGEYWNPVIEHLISRGITPVFLGKSVVQTGNSKNVFTEFDRGIRFDRGLDLRDKTTLMQAAAIMSRAQAVIGHDNGLLHLAGCTEVPIVFGYNLASPEHRRPKRAIGKIYDVVLTDKELICNFCQSKTNFVIGYNFRECFYRDLKCIDLLFANKASKWVDQIELALQKS